MGNGWVGFLVGLFIGANVGYLVLALFSSPDQVRRPTAR